MGALLPASLEMQHETGYSITQSLFKCRCPSEDPNMDLLGQLASERVNTADEMGNAVLLVLILG